jgi:hypothetical protein
MNVTQTAESGETDKRIGWTYEFYNSCTGEWVPMTLNNSSVSEQTVRARSDIRNISPIYDDQSDEVGTDE